MDPLFHDPDPDQNDTDPKHSLVEKAVEE